MPNYEYYCKQCGQKFAKTMTFSQHGRHARPPCPKCHGRKVRQLPSVFQAVTSKKT